MAKIPGLDPSRKPSGDGPSQPGGPAANQPAPFLQKRRNQILAAVMLLAVLLIVPLFGMGSAPVDDRQLSDVLSALPTGQIDGHKITKAAIDDDNRVVQITLDSGEEFETSYPNQFGTELVKDLQAAGIPFTTEPITKASPLGALAAMLLPVLMIIGFFVWMSKKGAMGMSGATNAKAFTATKAELPEPPDARFNDVVGCDEAVEELS